MSITKMKSRRRQFVQKNHDMGVSENNFGMTLIDSNKKLPVESLKFNRQYQRATETARKESVKQSIIDCGHYLPDQSITVNQDNEVVDGQHRLLAAIDLGINAIPATIYNFSDKKKEAAFFVHINGFDQRLNQVDYWYGRFLAGDPVAEFLYYLESSKESSLYEKIVVKGSNTSKKISTTMALAIIMYAVGFKNKNWQKKDHPALVTRLKQAGEKKVLFFINDFVSWYESIFGTKKENTVAYNLDVFRAILALHIRLASEGLQNQKNTINKLKRFNLGTAFITAPLAGKKYQLIDHFNKGRQKNKIPYNLEKE